jgi:hypothetical protein
MMASRQIMKEKMAKLRMEEDEDGDILNRNAADEVENERLPNLEEIIEEKDDGVEVKVSENEKQDGDEAKVEDKEDKDENKKEIKELEKPVSELTEAEKKQLEKLRERDREVRRHEQAHKAAAGPYARGVRYTYQRGPDGRLYAIGGSIVIDTSPVPGDPEATIRKAQVIRRAALAPADPSPQDRKIAAKAAEMERKAREELREERMEEMKGEESGEVEGKEAEAAGDKEIKAEEITPELERKIIQQLELHPEMDERDLKRWLKQTEGIEISEQEIKKFLLKIGIKMLKKAMDQPKVIPQMLESNLATEPQMEKLEIAEGQPFSLNPIIYGSYDFFAIGRNLDVSA